MPTRLFVENWANLNSIKQSDWELSKAFGKCAWCKSYVDTIIILYIVECQPSASLSYGYVGDIYFECSNEHIANSSNELITHRRTVSLKAIVHRGMFLVRLHVEGKEMKNSFHCLSFRVRMLLGYEFSYIACIAVFQSNFKDHLGIVLISRRRLRSENCLLHIIFFFTFKITSIPPQHMFLGKQCFAPFQTSSWHKKKLKMQRILGLSKKKSAQFLQNLKVLVLSIMKYYLV